MEPASGSYSALKPLVTEMKCSDVLTPHLISPERNSFFEYCPVCSSTEAEQVVDFPEPRFVRCLVCKLVYKSHQLADLQERLTSGYDANYFENGGAQYLKRWHHRVSKCRRQLLACLEYAPHARHILDVGCSAGYVLGAAKQLGLRPIGVDVAPFATRLARSRGFHTAVASLTALPFARGSFDIVTAKHTLEHVTTPRRAWEEVARVLAPGGVAFIIVPDSDYFRLRLFPKSGRYFRPEKLGWQHHVYYDAKVLGRALTASGLEVVSTSKAIFRRRLATGARKPWEYARFGLVKLGTTLAELTHLRREIQLIARKPR